MAMKAIRRVALMAFLRGSSDPKDLMPGCANIDRDHGGCLLREKGCLVDRAKRCRWFERAVLPTANQIGQRIELMAEYETRTGAVAYRPKPTETREDRRCGCGAPLPPRRRCCDKCQRQRAVAGNRKRRSRIKAQRCTELAPPEGPGRPLDAP